MTYTSVQARLDTLDKLVFNKKTNHATSLSKALSDRSSRVRWFAVDLIERNRVAALAREIELLLEERHWGIRTSAAVCLGSLLEPTGKAQHALRKLLKDPEWVVRIDAMESLQSLEDTGALPLIAKLLHDENAIVRSYCATILVEMSGSTYKPQLLKRLKTESDHAALVGLRSALFSTGEKHLLPEILNLLSCEKYQTRCAAVRSFENLPLTPHPRRDVINALIRLRRHEPTRAVTSTITSALKIIRANKETV